jgi:hypothetical protein
MTMTMTIGLTEFNTLLPRHYGMGPQVHLYHKYGSFHHNFSLPVEPQVWNQYVSANELHQF